MLVTAQRQEKTSQMANTSRENSGHGGFFALFALFTRFINDRLTRSRLRMEILGASRCFSTWLGQSSRGTQLHYNRTCVEGASRKRLLKKNGSVYQSEVISDCSEAATCSKRAMVRR